MVAFPSMLPDSKRDTKHCKGPATTALTGMLPTPAAGIASSLRASVMQYASTGIIPTAFGWIYAEVTQNRVAKVHCIRSCAYPSTAAKIGEATFPASVDRYASTKCLPDTEDRAFHR